MPTYKLRYDHLFSPIFIQRSCVYFCVNEKRLPLSFINSKKKCESSPFFYLLPLISRPNFDMNCALSSPTLFRCSKFKCALITSKMPVPPSFTNLCNIARRFCNSGKPAFSAASFAANLAFNCENEK